MSALFNKCLPGVSEFGLGVGRGVLVPGSEEEGKGYKGFEVVVRGGRDS